MKSTAVGPSVDGKAPNPNRERVETRTPLASAARMLATIIGAALLAAPAAYSAAAPAQPPSAVEFAKIFVATANAYSVAHHDARRVAKPDCVEAARGRYMCAYTAVKPAGRECHLMQARWTPKAASTITVTLSGRTHRCDSVRSAIRSLP